MPNIPIIDSHLDLAWNAVSWNRDLTLPLEELNRIETGMTDHRARGHATVSLPDMRRGAVVVCLGTLLARSKPRTRPPEGYKRRELDFANQAIASAAARSQLAYYRILERSGELRIITNPQALSDHWKNASNSPTASPVGVIIAMEGADPIVSVDELEDWHQAGLRVIGLAHYGPSAYAVGTGSSGPLTSAGLELLKEMARLKMILDLTHCCDESFWQAMNLYEGPVLASHNNCRALVPGDRQFSDQQIRVITERGGVIGVALDAWMLQAGWKVGVTTSAGLTFDAVADQIDHICQIAGDAKHVGIGSDLDGGFGTEQTPEDLHSIADLQKLAPLLENRGYSNYDVLGVFHRNWLEFFERHL